MNMRRYKKITYRQEYGKVEMRAILQSRTGVLGLQIITVIVV